MPEIDRYRPEDQRGVDALYRRVFGPDAAAASRLRWDWQYRRNPNNPEGQALLWVVREGPTIIGHYATMPVRLSLGGKEIQAAWGTDAMVAPERQRRGLGEELFRTWDRSVGAALGLGLSGASSALLKKMHFPDVAAIPGVVKPLTRRAVRMPQWPMTLNRIVSAVTLPIVRVAARVRPLRADVEPIRRFDASFTDLWERLADRFELAVRRDAAYLNWKFIEPPHVRYSVAALKRDGRPEGYAVYRHVQEPRGRVTVLVDFLSDTHDEIGFKTLLRWVDAEAREAGSDKIRCYASHVGFRRIMRHSGYFQMRSNPLALAAKINAVTVPAKFYKDTDDWHVTLGGLGSGCQHQRVGLSMALVEDVNKAITDAMKAKDAARLVALRMLKAALMNREVERGRALDEGEARQVVSALVKQRRDSIEQFTKGGRKDLADKETAEIAILEGYLPPAVDAVELEKAVDAAIASTGATSAKDMGRVMKAVMADLAGKTVDGKAVNELVRRKLG